MSNVTTPMKPDDGLIPEVNTGLGGESPRISVSLGGLDVEVQGGEDDSLAETKAAYFEVLEDALARCESMSQALRSRLVGLF